MSTAVIEEDSTGIVEVAIDVGKLLTDRMAQIIRQAGEFVTPFYGAEVEASELEKLNENETRAFISVREDGATDIGLASGGDVVAGDIRLIVYGARDNGDIAVVLRTKAIVALGYTNEKTGRFGQRFQKPFSMGGAKFLVYEPIGKQFTEECSLENKNWRKEQIIEFEMRQPGV